jgi:hypothetical protein
MSFNALETVAKFNEHQAQELLKRIYAFEWNVELFNHLAITMLAMDLEDTYCGRVKYFVENVVHYETLVHQKKQFVANYPLANPDEYVNHQKAVSDCIFELYLMIQETAKL